MALPFLSEVNLKSVIGQSGFEFLKNLNILDSLKVFDFVLPISKDNWMFYVVSTTIVSLPQTVTSRGIKSGLPLSSAHPFSLSKLIEINPENWIPLLVEIIKL